MHTVHVTPSGAYVGSCAMLSYIRVCSVHTSCMVASLLERAARDVDHLAVWRSVRSPRLCVNVACPGGLPPQVSPQRDPYMPVVYNEDSPLPLFRNVYFLPHLTTSASTQQYKHLDIQARCYHSRNQLRHGQKQGCRKDSSPETAAKTRIQDTPATKAYCINPRG